MKPLLLAILFVFIAQNAMALGGHKKESTPITTAEVSVTDPMYATEEKESDPFGGSQMFSPSDLFMEGEVVLPATNEPMKMEGNHNEHDKMPEVEPAKLSAVESSSKGYGVAIGITLFAGLVFCGLAFMRLGE